MTTFTASAAPPHAPRVWIASGSIFIEYPCVGAAPFIASYPLHPDGLGMALSGMIAAWQKANPTPRYVPTTSAPTPHPLVNAKTSASRPGTEAQRDNAAAILRKLGLTPKVRGDA